jgi:hypothetical protein
MKLALSFLLFTTATALHAQVWKVLPKGVRVVGYRNVTTSKINQNFNRTGQETSLGAQFKVDGMDCGRLVGSLPAKV